MMNIFKLHTYSKVAKWFIFGVSIIVVSATASVLLIKSLHKPSTSVTTPTPIYSTITPAELIKKYTASSKLTGYTLDSVTPNSIMSYAPNNVPYTVQISVPDSVQFERSSNSNPGNLSQVIKNGTSYLAGYGFTKVTEHIVTNATELTYASHANVCKIYDNLDTINESSKYGLACADKKLFSSEYNAIKPLIAIYYKSNSTAGIKGIVRVTHTEANISVSLLSITPQDSKASAYTLIFASIDNKWEYVGQRIAPSIDIKNSFNIPSDLKVAISNPKYKGLITKYVY